jgi:hypothetical protein
MQPTLRGLTRGFALLAVVQAAATVGASGPISATPFRLSAASIERITADSTGDSVHHVRSANRRIQEALEYGLAKSESFRDLVATLDFVDRVVYVEEGSCANAEHRSCLHLLAGSRNMIVQINPRQEIRVVVAQLAHELYHAAEVGREPAVTNAAELQALYERIGERSCSSPRGGCWETRAACAFEALVRGQLVGRRASE